MNSKVYCIKLVIGSCYKSMSLAGGAQQPASGRLGTFTSSSSDLPGNTKKKSPPSSIQKGTISWRPTVFDFKSGANKVCPTCQGTGRIPKGTLLLISVIYRKMVNNYIV